MLWDICEKNTRINTGMRNSLNSVSILGTFIASRAVTADTSWLSVYRKLSNICNCKNLWTENNSKLIKLPYYTIMIPYYKLIQKRALFFSNS